MKNHFTHILHLSLTLHFLPYFSKTRITPANKQIKIRYLKLLSPVAFISPSLTDVTATSALRAQFVNISPFQTLSAIRCASENRILGVYLQGKWVLAPSGMVQAASCSIHLPLNHSHVSLSCETISQAERYIKEFWGFFT